MIKTLFFSVFNQLSYLSKTSWLEPWINRLTLHVHNFLLHLNKVIEVKFLGVWVMRSAHGQFSLSSKDMVWRKLGWICTCRYRWRLPYTKAAWEMHAHAKNQGSEISLVRVGNLGQPVRLIRLNIICTDIYSFPGLHHSLKDDLPVASPKHISTCSHL